MDCCTIHKDCAMKFAELNYKWIRRRVCFFLKDRIEMLAILGDIRHTFIAENFCYINDGNFRPSSEAPAHRSHPMPQS